MFTKQGLRELFESNSLQFETGIVCMTELGDESSLILFGRMTKPPMSATEALDVLSVLSTLVGREKHKQGFRYALQSLARWEARDVLDGRQQRVGEGPRWLYGHILDRPSWCRLVIFELYHLLEEGDLPKTVVDALGL